MLLVFQNEALIFVCTLNMYMDLKTYSNNRLLESLRAAFLGQIAMI